MLAINLESTIKYFLYQHQQQESRRTAGGDLMMQGRMASTENIRNQFWSTWVLLCVSSFLGLQFQNLFRISFQIISRKGIQWFLKIITSSVTIVIPFVNTVLAWINILIWLICCFWGMLLYNLLLIVLFPYLDYMQEDDFQMIGASSFFFVVSACRVVLVST